MISPLKILSLAILSQSVTAQQSPTSESRQIDIYVWPVTAPEPSRWLSIDYDLSTFSTNAQNSRARITQRHALPSPPPSNDSPFNDIVRVGFFKSEKTWTGIALPSLTTVLDESRNKSLTLLLSQSSYTNDIEKTSGVDYEIYSLLLSISSPPLQSRSKSKTIGDNIEMRNGEIKVDFLLEPPLHQIGAKPVLNRNIIVDAEGKRVDGIGADGEKKQDERSFLAKYWWVILGIMIIQVALGGGGGADEKEGGGGAAAKK